jgi:hypothetical protein
MNSIKTLAAAVAVGFPAILWAATPQNFRSSLDLDFEYFPDVRPATHLE